MVNSHLSSGLVGDIESLGRQLPCDQDRRGADYAEFLAGNRRKVLSEELRVLHSDPGDHTDIGIHDIGGVEPTTQPDLEHGCVHCLIGEEGEGRRCRQLEVGARF